MAKAKTRTLPDGTKQRIRMSEAWWPAVLAHLKRTGNVTKSCEAAGISRQTYYQSYGQHADFARMADDALAQFVDSLEYLALERAVAGSDDLLKLLLRANRPDKYRERHEIQQTIQQSYIVEIGSPHESVRTITDTADSIETLRQHSASVSILDE